MTTSLRFPGRESYFYADRRIEISPPALNFPRNRRDLILTNEIKFSRCSFPKYIDHERETLKVLLGFLITFPNPTGVPSLRFFKLPWSLLHFFNYPYLLSWKRSLCRNETRRNDPHVFLPNYSLPPLFRERF